MTSACRTARDVDGRVAVEAVAFLVAVQGGHIGDAGAPPAHHERIGGGFPATTASPGRGMVTTTPSPSPATSASRAPLMVMGIGPRWFGTSGFRGGFGCRSPGTGAIMMKRTVAWAADNTPRDKVPDRLEEDVRLQDGRYKRLVQWSPESRAQRSPNMIVYNVTYETD